jgi:hypothetical protein
MTVFTPKKVTDSHFYRYQSPNLERLKPIILENEIYLPTVGQLNDPFDCRPKLAQLSQEEMVAFLHQGYVLGHPREPLDALAAQEAVVRANVQKHGLEWWMRESAKSLYAQMETFRIYSLSKRFDNPSLWAKYAAEHTGYCLEFANEGALFGEHTFEVTYGEYAPFNLVDWEARDVQFLVYKRPEWSNEEEIRLICARGSGSKAKIEPQWLTRVILGRNMSPTNQNQIREWARQRQPELVVVQAYVDDLHQRIRLRE